MRVKNEPTGSIFFDKSFHSPRWVVFFTAAITLTILLCGFWLYVEVFASPTDSQAVSSGQVKGVHSTQTPSETPSPSPSTAGGVPQQTTEPPRSIPAAPLCSRPATAALPGIILSEQPVGLTFIVNAPEYYQIFGYSYAEVARQMRQCSPISSGHSAATSYVFTRSYTVTQLSPEQCKIDNLKIGLRVSYRYPSWASSPYDQASLGAKWQRFMSALTTHEHGHGALNQQYAQRMVDELNSLPPTDCATIHSVVHTTYFRNIAALQQANEAYDISTGHGASQGAVF